MYKGSSQIKDEPSCVMTAVCFSTVSCRRGVCAPLLLTSCDRRPAVGRRRASGTRWTTPRRRARWRPRGGSGRSLARSTTTTTVRKACAPTELTHHSSDLFTFLFHLFIQDEIILLLVPPWGNLHSYLYLKTGMNTRINVLNNRF